MFYKLVFGQSEHFDLLKLVLESILSEEKDIVLVSEDGDIVETHKILLCMYSNTLAEIVDKNFVQGISIPLKTESIKNLIKILTEGTAIVNNKDDLANITNSGKNLGIDLTNLEIHTVDENIHAISDDEKGEKGNEDSINPDTVTELEPEDTHLLSDIENIIKVQIEEKSSENNCEENPLTQKNYKCEKCEESFSYLKRFNDHLLKGMCDSKITISCKHCNVKFKREKNFRRHIKNIHDRPQFKCSQCEEIFKTETRVDKHIRTTHMPNMCKFCKKELKNANSCRSHVFICRVRREAAGLSFAKYKTEEEFVKECDLCKKVFHSKGGLRKHMKTHKLIQLNESTTKMKIETIESN